MTSSTSSSTSALLGLALALSCAAPRPALRAPPPGMDRVAVFPLTNLSGAPVPLRAVQGAIEEDLAKRGITVVEDGRVDEFLAAHRVRWTGGIDAETARAAGEELGVNSVLLTAVELYDPAPPPRFAVSMRAVAADRTVAVRWADGFSRAGDDSPGLFDLGVVREYPVLQGEVIARLGASLAATLAGAPRARSCPDGGRFQPRESFRSPDLSAKPTWTVAVLPFLNESPRRHAGELLAHHFVRQLDSSGRFQVIEPGVVREQLLRFRLVMEGGVSLDIARVMLEIVRADFVLAGYVHEYDDNRTGAPAVQFTAMLLDRRDNVVVWESSSWNRGDDGVFFFDAGLIGTTPDLACRMVRGVVDGMIRPRPEAPKLAMPGKK